MHAVLLISDLKGTFRRTLLFVLIRSRQDFGDFQQFDHHWKLENLENSLEKKIGQNDGILVEVEALRVST